MPPTPHKRFAVKTAILKVVREWERARDSKLRAKWLRKHPPGWMKGLPVVPHGVAGRYEANGPIARCRETKSPTTRHPYHCELSATAIDALPTDRLGNDPQRESYSELAKGVYNARTTKGYEHTADSQAALDRAWHSRRDGAESPDGE